MATIIEFAPANVADIARHHIRNWVYLIKSFALIGRDIENVMCQ